MILKAEITDDEILTHITQQSKAYWGFPKEILLEWENLLTISKQYLRENKVFKLVIGEHIVGYYSYFSTDPTTIKLDNMFILPQYIGTGLGRVLMKDFIEKVRSAEFEKITLDAEPNAAGFYKKWGFVKVGELESSIKDRFLPIMELKLNE